MTSNMVITEEERRIFGFLKEVMKEFCLEVTVRVAGGWVRDKILGLPSDDLDFAIDKMSGEDFAGYIQKFQTLKGLQQRKIAVIRSNPDQSKHLETVRTKILDRDVDILNLRAEHYSEASRIPTIKVGTPLEDANRRDFTMNALFYNIHSEVVEDLTGMGLDDLTNGIVRTPLPALQTFRDDPLRILRAIRFASRFSFKVDTDIFSGAADTEVQQNLMVKISRERVKDELEKTLRGFNPLRGLILIKDLKIWNSVFVMPSANAWDPASIEQSLDLCKSAIWMSNRQCFAGIDLFEVLLAAVLYPVRNFSHVNAKGKAVSAPCHILTESLKFSKHLVNAVLDVQRGSIIVGSSLVNRFADLGRGDFGALVRSVGKRFVSAVVLDGCWALCRAKATLSSENVRNHISLMKMVQEKDLLSAISIKPLLRGHQISSILGLKPGPGLGRIIDEVIWWQLQNPTGSVEELETWITHEKDRLIRHSKRR